MNTHIYTLDPYNKAVSLGREICFQWHLCAGSSWILRAKSFRISRPRILSELSFYSPRKQKKKYGYTKLLHPRSFHLRGESLAYSATGGEIVSDLWSVKKKKKESTAYLSPPLTAGSSGASLRNEHPIEILGRSEIEPRRSSASIAAGIKKRNKKAREDRRGTKNEEEGR